MSHLKLLKMLKWQSVSLKITAPAILESLFAIKCCHCVNIIYFQVSTVKKHSEITKPPSEASFGFATYRYETWLLDLQEYKVLWIVHKGERMWEVYNCSSG